MERMKIFSPDTTEEKQKIIKNLTDKSAAFGIDLGTTNSAISVIPQGTAPVIIPLKDGKTTIPSCVMWTGEDRKFIVGREAYLARKTNAEAVCYSVKSLMQDPEAIVTFKVGDKILNMTPAEVSAEILKGLIAETRGYYGDIKDVVITVPAKFNEIGRSNTKKAAELAGLNLLGIINEPTAASMCYKLTPEDNGSRDLLVYDLGGGTFDISLVRITGKMDFSTIDKLYHVPEELRSQKSDVSIRALDSDGDTKLGGDDIDKMLYSNVIEGLSKQGYDTSKIKEVTKKSLIFLFEQLKKGNPNDSTSVPINLNNGESVTVNISYNEFMEALKPIYERTRVYVNNVLSRNRTSANTIILVGGSTKNPLLKELLKRDYPGYEINDAFPADESVALGAGVHSRFLKYGDNNISVFDSLADSIGVKASGRMSPIIERGSQFPVTKSKTYYTSEDNQKEIEVFILQGNSMEAEEACQLGSLLVDDLPEGKGGEVWIKIQLSIDVKGLLKCSVDVGNINEPTAVHRDLELKLSAGNTDTQREIKLSREDKLKLRWTRVAESLDNDKKKKLLDMIAEYPAKYNEFDIAKAIKEMR